MATSVIYIIKYTQICPTVIVPIKLISMAGENKKVEYMIGSDGVKYRIELTPIPENAKKIKKRQGLALKNRKRFYFLVAALLTLVLCGMLIVGLKIKNFSHDSMFSESLKRSVNFPLYYPRSLPQEFSLKEAPVKLANQTVIFTLNYGNDKELTVTQQLMPSNFDSSLLTGAESIDTKLGSAYMGEYGGHIIGIILAEKTLIFLNDPSGVDVGLLRKLIKQF